MSVIDRHIAKFNIAGADVDKYREYHNAGNALDAAHDGALGMSVSGASYRYERACKEWFATESYRRISGIPLTHPDTGAVIG